MRGTRATRGQLRDSLSGDAGNENSKCEASHAEQSALVWLPDPRQAYAMFCTNLPCFTCSKLILQTSITYVCALEDYPTPTGAFPYC